ncbi:MAG: tetratricopeptide repeat protein [Blastocatellia bacterium]|nr:tetratricopeptide repeat protein [Blastocatellia bacterium]
MKRSRLTLILWGVALVGAFGGNIPISAQTPKNPPPRIVIKNPLPTETKLLIQQVDELINQGKLDEAVAVARKAREVSSNALPAHLIYVRARMVQSSDPVALVEEYRAKMMAEPENPLYPLVLVQGAFLAIVVKEEERSRLLQKAADLAPDWSWGQFAAGQLLEAKGDKPAALAAYRKALELEPENSALVERLSWFLLAGKQFDQVISLNQKLVQGDPALYSAYTQMWRAQLGKAANAPETVQQVEKELEALIARADRSPAFLQFAANSYRNLLKRGDKAKPFDEELKSKYPDWGKYSGFAYTAAPNLTGLMRRYILAGQRNVAFRQIAEAAKIPDLAPRIAALEALDKEPLDDELRLYWAEQLANAYAQAKDIAKLELLAPKIVKLDPEDIGVYELVARTMLEHKSDARRVLKYAEMLTAATTSFSPAKRPKSYDEASWNEDFGAAEQREAFDQRRGNYLYVLGQVQAELGNLPKAETTLREAIAANSSVAARFQLGETLEKLGKPTEAAQAYADVIAETGGVPANTSLANLAGNLNLGGKAALALQGLEKKNPKINGQSLMTAALAAKKERIRVGLRKKFITEEPKDFEVANLAGTKVKLSSLRGKVVLMNFWASW